jgi:2-polyprenyl-3-methyl-5-hydroxy-6-metoxy-1,4-benzoquinol methylase
MPHPRGRRDERILRGQLSHRAVGASRVHDLMQGPLDERFDYVVAADVAEHVPDLDTMMGSLAGMLPSGELRS